MSVIACNLAHIRARLKNARLIAISKSRGVDEIQQALQAGQRAFGENRVQEAQVKFPGLRRAYPDLELHLIGPLQTNKAKDAVELFDVIQTLDRPALADALAAALGKINRVPRLYIEINIGREPQKSGIAPEKIEEFLSYCRTQCRLAISGLMCIPPMNQVPEPYFQRMRELTTLLRLPHLSMGMSSDYETAIECGATEVRIGSAIFGNRKHSS